MKFSKRHLILLMWLGLSGLACSSGPPCDGDVDCGSGYYCLKDGRELGASGACTQDCAADLECGNPLDPLFVHSCSDLGQCETRSRPPELEVLEPAPQTAFEEGSRIIRVSGRIKTAAAEIQVRVTQSGGNGCDGGIERRVNLSQTTGLELRTLEFVIDDVRIDSGTTEIRVEATQGNARAIQSVPISVDCPGCAEIRLDTAATVSGLMLPSLSGEVSAESAVDSLVWRVHGGAAGVFSGGASVSNGRFTISNLPLFAGLNQVEVVVSGVGTGLGESRCSQFVSSPIASEDGLRVLAYWDSEDADLDLHVVRPGGQYGDATTDLTPRSVSSDFGGIIADAVTGPGPEIAQVPFLAPGTYGVAVEAVHDGGDFGTSGLLWILVDGRLAQVGPVGPFFVSAGRGDLWLAGTIEVSDSTTWETLDHMVSASSPPTGSPDNWSSL